MKRAVRLKSDSPNDPTIANDGSLLGVYEGGDQGGGLLDADELLHHFTVLENDEGGDALDPELGGNSAGLVDVDLGDFGAFHLADDLFEDRALHPAGAAPRGPEVHQHEAGLGLGCKVLIVQFNDSSTHGLVPFVRCFLKLLDDDP